MPMLNPFHRLPVALCSRLLQLSSSLECVKAHEAEAEEDQRAELNAVDDHVGDESFDVTGGVVALEDWMSEVRL